MVLLTVDITDVKPDEIRITDEKMYLTCQLDGNECKLEIPIGLILRVRFFLKMGK